MPDVKRHADFETTNLFRTKTIYRTGAGRMQWGEGMIPPQNSVKEKKSRSFKVKTKDIDETWLSFNKYD